MVGQSVCAECVLPSSFPNITFNGDGVCNYCTSEVPAHQADFQQRQREEFQQVVDSSRGHRPYDAIACYSGGKDSTYMLKMMVRDWDLKVLAFTLDNGFITGQSKANITRVADLLAVDHIFFKPSRAFMTRMYRQAALGDLNRPRGNYATRISDICLACISVVNAHAARLAIQHHTPMIFAGFTPGQIPRAVIQNPQRHYRQTFEHHAEHFHVLLGPDAERYLDVPESGADLYQMSPYLVYEKSEALILDEIRLLGWEHPEGLDGCTSNCALNVVGNICHQKKYGFHPYALELSKLVRKGLLSRDQALEKLSQPVDEQLIQIAFQRVGFGADELGQNTKEAA
jgi:hypothetical protein